MKPGNILIFKNNQTYSVKLADFGISKALNANTTLSTVNVNTPGTVAWIAPEVQFESKEHVRIFQIFQDPP